MGSTKKIKMLLIERNCTQKQLADLLKTSAGNLGNKFARNNFSENELQEIADALDCDLEINFVLRESGKKF